MTLDQKPADRTTTRLPLLTYVLAAGTFLMGTTEFVVAGLLPEMARDLDVSVARAGLLITGFALGMIAGPPAMAILTRRLPPRWTLSLALVVFAAGHVVVAVGSIFTVLLLARFVTALATGAFWAVAAVVGARAAGPGASSRALGVVLGGGMLANVAGVPLGTFAGQLMGWQGPFWALAVLAALGAVGIRRFVPGEGPQHQVSSVRSELVALRSGRLWLTLAACAATTGGVLSAYSYLSPLLTQRAGVASALVPLVLAGFGAGALIGSLVGGRLGDRRPFHVMVGAASATVVVLAALCVLADEAVPVVVLVTLLGLVGLTANPVLVGFAVRFGGAAPTLASGLSTAAFNFGTAVGSWVAGVALESSLAETGPTVVGTVIAASTLVPVVALIRAQRRSTSAPR
ncbi:MFS transporter [Amycolatopsis thermoflava]|uniref:MFS transporter n=1 Tax=Amycolatopsis thermoflava TaxID=84480 RepID=UPI000429CCC7|nr:MFS transporter [Amycolatopsis thermoflava]